MEIFDKVLLSTEINNENIMQQENIVKENKENLNNVSLITKKGLSITDISMENLSKTDKAIILMKEKSNSIVSTNKEVLDKIKEFVENVNNVKKSTQGIESISTQTSLLSLNASIESSRAGETGRGFAVVASEVRNLADQTIVLTKSINEVVSQLEIEAKETQDIVNSIVDEVSNEDVIIEAVNETYTKLMNSVIDISKKASIINEDFDDINSINNEIYSEINNLIVSSKEGKKMIDNIVDIGKKNKDRALDAYSIINEINDNALNLKNNSL